MRRVILADPAYRDLVRLEEWLRNRNPSASLKMSVALDKALHSLKEFAERGRRGPRPGQHELPVPFGAAAYLVQYRIYDDLVIVARIRHSRERRRDQA